MPWKISLTFVIKKLRMETNRRGMKVIYYSIRLKLKAKLNCTVSSTLSTILVSVDILLLIYEVDPTSFTPYSTIHGKFMR